MKANDNILQMVEQTLAVLFALGAIIAALGYVIGQFKRGSRKNNEEERDEIQSTLDIASREIELLKGTLDRRDSFVATLQKQITSLTDEVSSLRAENAELRKLVMGERVPEALFRAMMKVAAEEGDKSRDKMQQQHEQLIALVEQNHGELVTFLASRCPVFDAASGKFVAPVEMS